MRPTSSQAAAVRLQPAHVLQKVLFYRKDGSRHPRLRSRGPARVAVHAASGDVSDEIRAPQNGSVTTPSEEPSTSYLSDEEVCGTPHSPQADVYPAQRRRLPTAPCVRAVLRRLRSWCRTLRASSASWMSCAQWTPRATTHSRRSGGGSSASRPKRAAGAAKAPCTLSATPTASPLLSSGLQSLSSPGFAVPPARLLGELEPGSLRSLWKASVGRYLLDPPSAAALMGGASLWDDLPTAPGQVRAGKPQGAQRPCAAASPALPDAVPLRRWSVSRAAASATC
jgi:hypothetical protein